MKFIQGALKLPIFWQLWLLVLVAVNGVLPFFFLDQPAAIIVISAMFVGGIIGIVLAEVQGFTKLLGLMHGPWVPMFVFQIIVFVNNDPTGNFAIWLITSMVVTGISLVIDVIDVISYMRGNRTDLLEE